MTQTGTPIVPRDAATVMLVRDGEDGMEVCMLQRSLRSDFVGGAYVFPGGAVDAEDAGAAATALCDGRDDAGASAELGIESGGLAYFVAAIRECFEEAGVLLARPAGGAASAAEVEMAGASESGRESAVPLVSFAQAQDAERWTRLRGELNRGARGFTEICAGEGVRLAADHLHYFSHWITPVGPPRRYDTRFFVAEAPAHQVALHDDHETVDTVWVRPADAIRRQAAGELEIIFPTLRQLEAIGRFGAAAELVSAAAAIEAVPAILPRIVSDATGMRILLPGDPGYGEIVAQGASSGA